MKVASGSAAAAAGPSSALKAGKTAGGAGEVVRCLSEQSVAISRCAGGAGARLPALLDEQQVNVLLYDMNGCYSRLKELVPTLPQNRKVSRVEILQHVIDYIWDLELELNSESQVGTPGGRGPLPRAPLSTLNGEISALAAEAACVPAGRSHLVSLKRLSQGLADPSPPGGEKNSCSLILPSALPELGRNKIEISDRGGACWIQPRAGGLTRAGRPSLHTYPDTRDLGDPQCVSIF
ncbi:LOW QUALITY PROTEIN: DNA-binding protein inhibitor ID-1 [Zalophus californianus]|uniref:DNA-binding protein inhibitor ID-3 n=1 Tax=Zalophus californianus TaxID=9704 RepID=A0A6J2FFF1_ZALCA|nr:LOW QUALITY PROTEIN: DNA-binding protein inhibitor ID-1 [Zalophus californianus]